MMAIGMSLVYGISRVFNFAYGSLFTLGGYLAWILFSPGLGLGYPQVFACAIPLLFFIGLAVERFNIRPLRARKDWGILVVMSTLGLALLLDNLYLVVFGPFVKSLPPLFEGSVHIGGLIIMKESIGMSATALGAVIAFLFFLHKTSMGLAMQAVAQDTLGAEIVGIPKDRVFGYTFAIATVLVGVGAILLAPRHFISPSGGWEILVKAWVITAFGGMGSILGALLAAYVLGIVEATVGRLLGLDWNMVVWFVVLLITFLVRPQGIRGTWG